MAVCRVQTCQKHSKEVLFSALLSMAGPSAWHGPLNASKIGVLKYGERCARIEGVFVNNMFSKSAIWVVGALLLFMLSKQFDSHGVSGGSKSIAYSELLDEIHAKKIK